MPIIFLSCLFLMLTQVFGDLEYQTPDYAIKWYMVTDLSLGGRLHEGNKWFGDKASLVALSVGTHIVRDPLMRPYSTGFTLLAQIQPRDFFAEMKYVRSLWRVRGRRGRLFAPELVASTGISFNWHFAEGEGWGEGLSAGLMAYSGVLGGLEISPLIDWESNVSWCIRWTARMCLIPKRFSN